MAIGQFHNWGYINVSGGAFLKDIYTEHDDENNNRFVYYLYSKTSNTLTLTFILNAIGSSSSSAQMTLTALTLS